MHSPQPLTGDNQRAKLAGLTQGANGPRQGQANVASSQLSLANVAVTSGRGKWSWQRRSAHPHGEA